MSHEQQEKLFPSVELLPGKVFYHDKLCILDIETFIHHHQKQKFLLPWSEMMQHHLIKHVM